MIQQSATATVSPTPSATYRNLVSRGLNPSEAANVVAYLTGIPLGDQPWTIHAVNTILFLRELSRSSRFLPNDGAVRPDGRLLCARGLPPGPRGDLREASR